MSDARLRELAHRSSAGIDVTLAWAPDSDSIVVLCGASDGPVTEIVVRRDDALLAFHHPFAYAALLDLSATSDATAPKRDRSNVEAAWVVPEGA